jgi:hypothetical protein
LPVEAELASTYVILICSTFIRVNKSCFVDFKLFKSSSSKVVFHGGHLPDFQNFENGFRLYWTCPTYNTELVLLISSYFSLSSMKVVFHRGNIPDFQNLENCFSF